MRSFQSIQFYGFCWFLCLLIYSNSYEKKLNSVISVRLIIALKLKIDSSYSNIQQIGWNRVYQLVYCLYKTLSSFHVLFWQTIGLVKMTHKPTNLISTFLFPPMLTMFMLFNKIATVSFLVHNHQPCIQTSLR